MDLFSLFFFVIFILIFMVPLWQRRLLMIRRAKLLSQLEKKDNSRFITLIHRQEALSFLGFPLARYIDIDDSEQILRAVRMTGPDVPINIILHTPGGLVLASEQIASALKRHKAKVTAYVPHYAMSGGTMIALAADEIVMDVDAVIGPVDPIIGDAWRSYPAASVLAALETVNPNRDDNTLIMGDIAGKAITQTKNQVFEYIKGKVEDEQAEKLAEMLTTGVWTHDFPIDPEAARGFGLNVSTDLPHEVFELMDYYPQASQRRSAVEYLPNPHRGRS
jgi:ClpP class serine protease